MPPGTVRRTGWIPQSQMPLFYRVIDVSVLLSSRREGHSMFALESMACGVPLIATAIGGNREIVRHGVNG
ncbi:MAG: glycosyltransferase family 4 protein, partial [Candidatus Korarchaeota archaeon]|nr:glycosyltransferase family 4 protein [Candidatus Korarchaeota archaeon]